MERERRFVPMKESRVALRQEGESRFLDGLGIVFNSWSEDLGGFIERILPEAVEQVLEVSDIRAMFNHDSNAILGRVGAGTMTLEVRPEGVAYSIDLPDTTAGRDVGVSVGRGDVDGSSFQFTVASKGDRWEERDGIVTRTIHRFQEIHEMGPVVFPAYAGTVVSARSLEMAEQVTKLDPKEVERTLFFQKHYTFTAGR